MSGRLDRGGAPGADAATPPLYRLTLVLEDADLARRVAARLTELEVFGALAVALFDHPGGQGHTVDAYVHSAPGAAEIVAALELPQDVVERYLTIEPVPDENWVAVSQAALPVVVAGRFLVHGSHDRARAGMGPGAIEIDAGEAFGTAHHATTSGCLLAIDRLARKTSPRVILDLGCGSGVLAIAAARAWPRALVLASDSDPVAVAVAAANARRNRMGRRIRPVVARGLAHPLLRRPAAFDLVIANILAAPLIRLCARLARAVAPGGRAVLSGLLAHQSSEVRGAYRAAGFAVEQEVCIAGWSILQLKRLASHPAPT